MAVIRPFRLNLRLTAQQGLFLIAFSEQRNFEESLAHNAALVEVNPILHKITLKRYDRREILRELAGMSITHENLFPGVDGYAFSSGNRYELASPWYRF